MSEGGEGGYKAIGILLRATERPLVGRSPQTTSLLFQECMVVEWKMLYSEKDRRDPRQNLKKEDLGWWVGVEAGGGGGRGARDLTFGTSPNFHFRPGIVSVRFFATIFRTKS